MQIGTARLGRLVAVAAVVCAVLATGSAVATSTAATAAPGAAEQATPMTTVTFRATGCGGCQVRVYQGLRHGHRSTLWQSRTKVVRDGRVTFRVPTRRTHGMSTTVIAPWEGDTGYVTSVAYRYGGEEPGSTVDLRAARSKRFASACWAGTGRSRVVLPLEVRKVRVPGVVTGDRVAGSIAWIGHTKRWWPPMLRAHRGIVGTQDAIYCRRP